MTRTVEIILTFYLTIMNKIALLFSLLLITSLPVHSLELVTSIKPLQLMAAALILPQDQVNYLIPPNASPHTYGLKPSAIQQARQADLVLWVGMENKWEKLFINLDSSIELAQALGLKEEEEHHSEQHHSEQHHSEERHDEEHHDKEHHSEEHHDEQHHSEERHDEEHHDKEHHDKEHHDKEHHSEEHHEEEHSHHDHSHAVDLHIWLSPPLVRQAATIITDRLIQLNPAQAESYQQKLAAFERDLTTTIDTINNNLISVRNKKFYTMHDAFNYFTSYFHLSNTGYLTFSPEIPLSASHLQTIRSDLKNNDIVCIFSEPQLDESAALKLIEGTRVRHGILDPLAGNIEVKSYFNFLHSLANSFRQCLAS